jgi:ribosomal protein S1
MTRIIGSGIAAVLLAAGLAAAHEQSLHKGRSMEGEVVSVSEDGIVMQTAKGHVSVTLSESTTVERGDEKLARDAVHTGDHVTVFGTTLATGELVASEVVIGGAHDHDRHTGGHRDK